MKKLLSALSISLLLAAAGFAFAADGAAVYKSCAGCHGSDGTKKAGESTPLKGQGADAILKKMQGYADGSYGGTQKKMMENIAKKMSAEDMTAVADYASKL